MEFQVNDEHVYLTNERGELLANADFRETAPGVFDIYHTVVLPELRGHGVASKLVARTVEEIHQRGGKVTATCTYAKVWLKRHPQEKNPISRDTKTVENCNSCGSPPFSPAIKIKIVPASG